MSVQLELDPMPRDTVEHVFVLPPASGAVSAVRRRAGAVLTGWDVSPEIVEDSLLVVSELLTNALVHALPPAELRLSWVRGEGTGTLRVEVTDAGPARTAGQSPARVDPDEHGRGEHIVHALAARHGIRIHSGGITRWADLVTAAHGRTAQT